MKASYPRRYHNRNDSGPLWFTIALLFAAIVVAGTVYAATVFAAAWVLVALVAP